MTENYTVRKRIERIGLDMEVTVVSRELMIRLDDVIRQTVMEYYGLKAEEYDG